MTSAETPATPSCKSSACGWQSPTVMILGIVMWIAIGVAVTHSLKKPRQHLPF